MPVGNWFYLVDEYPTVIEIINAYSIMVIGTNK